WALRQVLGEHVRQAGSLVAPDRLRFDFSHFEAVSGDDLRRVEELVNGEVLANSPVRAYETTKRHADEIGAISFFGEKYGEMVRVIEAGDRSIELCGGTHVFALGTIGPIKVLGESSIGANVRRIEALTGEATLAHFGEAEGALQRTASLLRAPCLEVPERVEKILAQVKTLQDQIQATRADEAGREAGELAASAIDGVVGVRRDGAGPDDLRRLAQAVRDALGSGVAILVGASSDGAKAGIAVAVSRDLQELGVSAGEVAAQAARALGGGTSKNPDAVSGGGPRVESVDAALALARQRAEEEVSRARGSPPPASGS
ncbi:MAG: DHHA1 domain-containing protein, partial [Acidimicrobiia bacterium]